METSRGPVSRSSSYYNEYDHPVEDVVILGSILSRKSWSNSLHRHLPSNNRWKDRYFVIENGEVLSIISSGRRMNLSIGRMALCYHEYSPNGSNVLAVTYYDGIDSQNTLHNTSSKTSVTTPTFVNTYKKELEIQLQYIATIVFGKTLVLTCLFNRIWLVIFVKLTQRNHCRI